MFDTINTYEGEDTVSPPRHSIKRGGFHNPLFLLYLERNCLETYTVTPFLFLCIGLGIFVLICVFFALIGSLMAQRRRYALRSYPYIKYVIC